MRRTLVAGIDSTIDFSSPDHIRRYLRVVERVLEQLGDTSRITTHPWAGDTAKKILRELRRAGVVPDVHERLELPARVGSSRALAAAPDETGIRLTINALGRTDAEPEERIGAAKDLVEATIKFGLDQLGETYGPRDDIGALAKRLHARLRVDPSGIAPTAAGADTIVRILGGLTNIPAGLAELRNAGYGTGHGRARRISGIKDRHAELAARAAVAYATFLLDTLTDPEAPWRKG
ncbi:MAG: abortive infection family protein [Chloroflexi bacterium]|nr:abortive infection family protein [Chloroflexota bacterium]